MYTYSLYYVYTYHVGNLLWPAANTVDTRAIYLCATSTHPWPSRPPPSHIYRPQRI